MLLQKNESKVVYVHVCVSCSVMSDSLQPHGLLLVMLLCLWNSPGKNTGVGSHSLLFSRESSQPRDRTRVSHIAGRFFTIWTTREAQNLLRRICIWSFLCDPAPLFARKRWLPTSRAYTVIKGGWKMNSLRRTFPEAAFPCITHNWAYSARCFKTGWEDQRRQFSSVQFSRSVISDSLWPHGLQHARLPCPSPTPRVYTNSCPLSWLCHPTISSSVVLFSSHLHPSQLQGLFKWVSASYQVAKILEFQL